MTENVVKLEKSKDIPMLFAEMDKDHSGSVDHDEFREGMLKVEFQGGLRFRADDIEKLIELYDDDGDGMIDYFEFAKYLNQMLTGRSFKYTGSIAS